VQLTAHTDGAGGRTTGFCGRDIALIALNVAPWALTSGWVAWLGWFGPDWALGAIVVLPLAWALIGWRAASASALAYFSVAFAPLPAAIDALADHQSLVPGWLWAACIVGLISAMWVLAAYAPRTRAGSVAALAVVAVVSAAPPLGSIVWAHPIHGLGWVAPAGGFAATTMCLAAWSLAPLARDGIASATMRAVLPMALVAVALVLAWSGRGVAAEGEGASGGVLALHTQWATPTNVSEVDAKALMVRDLVLLQRNGVAPGTLLVLPETTFGEWRPAVEVLAMTHLGSASYANPLLVGASWRDDDGRLWNGAVLIRDGQWRFIRGRQPVPLGMWQPWAPDRHHSADWGAPSEITLGDTRYSLRICGEEFTPFWMALDLSRGNPRAVIGLSNTWWATWHAQGDSQRRHAVAMARLAGVPLVRAVNHGVQLPRHENVPSIARQR